MADLISVDKDFFEQHEQLEAIYRSHFEPSLATMEALFEVLKSDEGFKGKASDGFLALFELLLKFHADLQAVFPDFHEAFLQYHQDLQSVKTTRDYLLMLEVPVD